MRADVQLAIRPHPFDQSKRTVRRVAAGETVAELLRGHAPKGYEGADVHWAVTIDGRPVPPERIEELRPRPGALVTARLTPRDPVTIGYWVAYGVSYSLASVGVSQGIAAVVGFVVGTAATVFAGIAYSRAFAPDFGSASGAPGSKPFYSVTGSRNQIRPHGVIPHYYGSLRVVPDLLGLPVTAVSPDAVQTVRQLFCVGAGFYDIGQIYYGSQDSESLGLSLYELYHGRGVTPPSAAMPTYMQNTFEEQLGLQLRHLAYTGSEEHVRTTAATALGFDVQLVFPQGLWRISDSGREQPAAVRVVVRYRPSSGGAWTALANERLSGFIPKKFARNYHADTAAGEYEVSVKLHAEMGPGVYTSDRDGGGGSTALTGDAVWTSLRSYLLGQPISDARTEFVTMFGISLEAGVLINGQMDQISCDAIRVLPTWSAGSGWSDVALGAHNPAAYSQTQSPAWAFANELRDAGVPDDEIDAERIKEWADFCAAQGWACNLGQNDEVQLETALRTIASCGQAAPVMRGSLFSVTWDRAQEPVAAFGPHNARGLRITQAPIERVDAMRVRFSNEDADFQLDEMTVYFDGYDESTAEQYRTLDVLNGLTDPELVWRYVHLEREKGRLRNTIYQFDTDATALVVEVGDVVLLRYHGALIGDAETEVTGYSTRAGGSPLGSVFDEVFVYPPVRVEAGRTYSLRVRTREAGEDGGYRILTLPVVNPLTAGVQQLTALAVDGDVYVPTATSDESPSVAEPDDLEGQPAFLGEEDVGELLVTDVRIGEHGFAQITAVDSAPELFSYVVPPVVHTSGVTSIAANAPAAPVLVEPPPEFNDPDDPVPGAPYAVIVDPIGYLGYPVIDVHIPLQPPPSGSGAVERYELRWRLSLQRINDVDGWEYLTYPGSAADLVIPAINPLGAIDVEIFAVGPEPLRLRSATTALLDLLLSEPNPDYVIVFGGFY